MDSEEQRHIREMLHLYQRRLRVLELKEAWHGLSTPVDILMEIEDLRENIASCQSKIDTFPQSHDSLPNVDQFQTIDLSNAVRKPIEITFNGSFEGLTPEMQRAVVRAIAAIVEISPDQVKILNVRAGSVIFSMELPEEAATALIELYNSNDKIIEELGIQNIKLALERDLALSTLVQHAITENEQLFNFHQYDAPSTYEIFRRAIVDHDEVAFNAIVDLYTAQVRAWIQKWSSRIDREDFGEEDLDDFVRQSFARFKQTLSPNKIEKFINLASMLQYLRITTNSVMFEWWRPFNRTQFAQELEEAAPEYQAPAEEGIDAKTLWSLINQRLQNEKERVVLFSSFSLGLSPRETFQEYANLFESVEEVYQLKANVLARLARDTEFRKSIDSDSS